MSSYTGPMCGICGIATARGAVDRERLAAMSATLVHRGPDADGDLRRRRDRPRVAAPLDHRPRGRRPADRQRGRNGRPRPERRDLQLPRAARASSSAPATASAPTPTPRCSSTRYEEWGLGFAERLRGMFAIALWDARSRRLVLARDRFGIKPLYYRDVAGELAFASELDALPRGEIDPDALEAYLAFNSIPAPLSIFKEIRKLPAGHLLTWDDGIVTLDRFARPGPARGAARRRRGRAGRGVPRAAARLRARPSRRRRAGRRAPVRRRRLRRPRRARGRGVVGGRCARSRSASKRRRSTSSPAPERSPSVTAHATASSCSAPTPRCSCPRWPRRSTSRSATRPRCRPTSSRNSQPRT